MNWVTWLVLTVLGTEAAFGRVWFIPKSDDDSTLSSAKEVWRIDELGAKSKKDLSDYLAAYGYQSTFSDLYDNSNELNEQVKDLQYMAGLTVSGVLDKATVKLINTDRCGVKDPNPRQKRLDAEEKLRTGRSGRYRRFNHQGTKWKNACNLRWQYIHNPLARNAHLGEGNVKRVLRRAMKLWEDTSNIKFTEDQRTFKVGSDQEPEIMIQFTAGRKHNKMDPFPFDGQGGTLAHAFYPLHQTDISGDVHFDDAENYSVRRPTGDEVDLNWVTAHELGHSLGLDHSRQEGALMYPYYTGYIENMKLPYDDRTGVQTLYGGKVQGYCGGSKGEPKRQACPASRITALWSQSADVLVASTSDDKLYHLKKDGGGLADEGVVDKSRYFDVRGNIKAAYRTNLGKKGGPEYTVIFTTEGYYVYDGKRRVSGIHKFKGNDDAKTKREFCKMTDPNDRRPLRINFPSTVKSIDAVMKWQRNGKVYFFTKDALGMSDYWRFDERKQKFDCGYPRLMKPMWRGVPRDIDAAYSGEGKTFFVKGNDIFYFNDRSVRVKVTKDIRSELFKCKQ